MILQLLFILFNLFHPAYLLLLRETADHASRLHYYQGKKASKEIIHEVVFAIKQNNLDEIEKILYDVSTPGSASYGQHLSFDEVGRIVTNRQATSGVLNWLKSHSVDIRDQSYYGEYITARASVSVWEKLFDTTFHEYHPVEQFNTHNSHRSVIRALSYSLPEEVDPFIHTVLKLINLPPPKFISPIPKKLEFESLDSIPADYSNTVVYPQVLQYKYNIVGTGNGYGNQSVYESLSQTSAPEFLAQFQSYFGYLDNPVVSYYGDVPDFEVCYNESSSYEYCGEASLDLDYITTLANQVPTSFYYDSTNDTSYIDFIINLSDSVDITYVYSISYTTVEYFLTTSEVTIFNNEAMKLGTRGITLVAASGDDGAPGFLYRYGYLSLSQCGYFAMFPASSPYVTAVGGTIGGMETSGTVTTEVANSASVGGTITSGGGFSGLMSAPSYQTAAISSYKSKYVAKQSSFSSYSYSNRGYPDVSMTSNNYLTIIDNSSYFAVLSGTSASAPVFAAMVSLVNADRLQSSQPVLGWLNPSIYSNNGGFARDITSGNNDCTADPSLCCKIGFKATAGWDPVTGFGSIDYAKFLTYYQSLTKSTSSPTKNPTKSPTKTPTNYPSKSPTNNPSNSPTNYPTFIPSYFPTNTPDFISSAPTIYPSNSPSISPTISPIITPTIYPSNSPSISPTINPTVNPTNNPSKSPNIDDLSDSPTNAPTHSPTVFPSYKPSIQPTKTKQTTFTPTIDPTCSPTLTTTSFPSNNYNPTIIPTISPTNIPTNHPIISPTAKPTISPTNLPSYTPTTSPTISLPPTSNPTPNKPDSYIEYSYQVSQIVSSSVSANEFLSDEYAVNSFKTIISEIFSNLNPSYITIDSAVDIISVNNRRSLYKRMLSTNGIKCNYTIGFDSSTNLVSNSYSNELTNNITNTLVNAVSTNLFTDKLQESSSSILSSMTASTIPYISSPVVVHKSTTSNKSNNSLNAVDIILIAVLIGGSLLIGLIGSLLYCYSYSRRNQTRRQVDAPIDSNEKQIEFQQVVKL